MPPSTLLPWPGPAPSVVQITHGLEPFFQGLSRSSFGHAPHEVNPQECVLVDAASQDWVPVSVHRLNTLVFPFLRIQGDPDSSHARP